MLGTLFCGVANTKLPWRFTGRDPGQPIAVSLVLFLILLVIVGLFVGALARLLLPGPDPMGVGGTILVGLAGSFIAGLFSWYVLHRHGAGLILSVIFSMLLLWVRRRSTGGPMTGPRRRL